MVDLIKLCLVFAFLSVVVAGLMSLLGIEDNTSEEELDYIESTQMLVH